MKLDDQSIAALDKRYRAALINAVTGFKPANLIGTADAEGHSNLAIMSSVVHLGSRPPLLGLLIRPNPVDRHTLDNILETGCYTINHVGEHFIDAAHQTAARYPRDVSEFDATGLTVQWHDGFPAPFVGEATIRMGLCLREHQELAINGTHFIIGEIVLLEAPDDCVDSEGRLDLVRAGTVALSGLDTYHAARALKVMAYASPESAPQDIGSPSKQRPSK
ncbi:MAG: flavin reductase family protein [Chromatocurvus sp.]